DELHGVFIAVVLAAVAGVLVLGPEGLDERHRRQRSVLQVPPEVGLVLQVGGAVGPVLAGVVAEGAEVVQRLMVELEAGVGAVRVGGVGPGLQVGAGGPGAVGPPGAGGEAGGVGPSPAVPGP